MIAYIIALSIIICGSVNAQSMIYPVDSIFVKDQTTSFLTAYNFSKSRTANFEFENPRAERFYMNPVEHWEKYIKGTYSDVDSITYRNRESLEPITEVPMHVRMVFLWKMVNTFVALHTGLSINTYDLFLTAP